MWYGKFNLDNCTHTLDFMEACFLLLSFLESYRYYSSIRTRGLFTSKTTITSFRKYIVHTAMHRQKTALFVRHERLFVKMQQFQHNSQFIVPFNPSLLLSSLLFSQVLQLIIFAAFIANILIVVVLVAPISI